MIAIVDYKAGNLASVKKAFDHIGAQSRITSDPTDVRRADKIVLPGVGHFATTHALEQSGLRDGILEALGQGVPFLGICVGLQWLFQGSEEAPEQSGLGLFQGTCARFENGMKVPHVGWNDIALNADSPLLRGLKPNEFVYFTHSYRAPIAQGTTATCIYGGEFSAAVERDNIFGVQFHPEKSAAAGLQILRNFSELKC